MDDGKSSTEEEKTMFRLKHIHTGGKTFHACIALIAVLFVLPVVFPSPACGQGIRQKTFASPEDALKGLAAAVQAGNKKGMMEILGPESEPLVSSGDEVRDSEEREWFIKAYQDRADLVPEKENRVAVLLGKDSWPFPIPIVKKGDGWAFDTKEGKEELLNRRIGQNELDAIETCLAFVEAQRDYAETDRQRDGIIQYARKIVSTPGKRDGLYWKPEEGEMPSPLGPLAAKAAEEGYGTVTDKSSPYHGYYYKILQGQGKSAAGGAYSYVINGHMVAGFAFAAWPAEYGESGVMTFIVNANGIVYEKDLGPKTGQLAKAMKLYNPDKTWKRAK
jgi:hypothetical protein